MTTTIAIAGCAGRMGRMLTAQVLDTEGAVLAGGTEHVQSPHLGADLGTLAGREAVGLTATADVGALFKEAQVVIDFTLPDAVATNAETAARKGAALVIGTTGLGPEHQAAIDEAARSVAVVQAGNMSLGVNLLLGLARQVSAALGDSYDVEILEMHHRHKVDAPSGTALMLGQAVAAGRGVDLDAVSQRVRDGVTGERRPGDIGFATLRGGDVTGEHTVIFAGPGERLELTHKASSRGLFAAGAVTAALWCARQAPGRYDMLDVLGMRSGG
ncbi:MAG: 4-hydroxy-tetrahydrodipicolinate reductase [Rhodobacterales bacterium]|nr:4-hydroxy-tetrahydrodipicolinate reductase [Rhodobacterales bacterium]